MIELLLGILLVGMGATILVVIAYVAYLVDRSF